MTYDSSSEKPVFAYISSEELLPKRQDENTMVIDIRPVEAYNGWKLNSEKRGGHIAGAKSLPYKWSNYIDFIEIIESKGISREKHLVIYGYDKNLSEEVAGKLQKFGFENIKIYAEFLDKWSAEHSFPMEKLERYKHLVSAEWLNDLINKREVDEYDNNDYVICHAHYRNYDDYLEGHIPGSIALDTLTLESPETWNRRTPSEINETLLSLGITSDTTVILYGRFSFPDNNDPFPGSSAGHLGSIRCALIMLYAGVKDVRILNGGLQAWLDAGFDTTQEVFKQIVNLISG